MTLWVHICILNFKIWYCIVSYYYSCLSASYITPWGSELVIRGLFIATHPHQLLFITLSQCPRYCFVISKRKCYRVSCLRSLVFTLPVGGDKTFLSQIDFTLCLHLHISFKKEEIFRFFSFFIGQVDLGIHTLSSTQKSFDYTAETRLHVKLSLFRYCPAVWRRLIHS